MFIHNSWYMTKQPQLCHSFISLLCHSPILVTSLVCLLVTLSVNLHSLLKLWKLIRHDTCFPLGFNIVRQWDRQHEKKSAQGGLQFDAHVQHSGDKFFFLKICPSGQILTGMEKVKGHPVTEKWKAVRWRTAFHFFRPCQNLSVNTKPCDVASAVSSNSRALKIIELKMHFCLLLQVMWCRFWIETMFLFYFYIVCKVQDYFYGWKIMNVFLNLGAVQNVILFLLSLYVYLVQVCQIGCYKSLVFLFLMH